ncbi:MAG TPA: PilZ domain-containing protein [bacterium]|nr:PilZ domain-containing protein [bacterium]
MISFTEKMVVDERRQAHRYPTSRHGRLLAGSGDGWGNAVPVVACDVSSGGLLIASSAWNANVAKGVPVEVKIALDEGFCILPARVAWVTETSSGAWIAGLALASQLVDAKARAAFDRWRDEAAQA